MPGRAMIVGRSSRSQIVGAGPGAPAPPLGHPHHPARHPHHPHHGHWLAHAHLFGQGPSPEPFGSAYEPGHPEHAHRHPYGVPVSYQREGAPIITEVHPTHPREFPIGFSSETLPLGVVPAGQTQPIEQKPQVLFRGERLAVPNSIVLNFDLEDIKVGKDSQLASPGSMPAECFSNLSVGVRMQLDTAEPGITITLSVTNDDPNNAHVFKSVLYGTVIE
jgi:hypothetical protein